jgi:hypothetical protein
MKASRLLLKNSSSNVQSLKGTFMLGALFKDKDKTITYKGTDLIQTLLIYV